ncbi:MAG TPA: ABC transporter substrate-binding protein [Candidatus Limnocylindrales bacterium]
MIPTRARRRPAGFLIRSALIAVIVAGCGATASAVPATVGPSPTAVIAAAATGTPLPASLAPSPSPSAAAYPLSLKDDEGTAVTIPARPTRIVSLTPATTEILFAVGAGPRVKGVTDADDYPPAAKQITQVVKLGAVDVERIVGLGADLVIAGGNSFNSPDSIAKLRALGIPVVVVYAADVAGVFRDIGLVATAAGAAAAGASLVASLQSQGDAVVAAVATAGAPRPRVFYELDATKQVYTFADGIVQDDLIRMAGGDPITTGSPTVFSIPLEKLVVADPQLILLGDAAYGTTPAQVAARPGWSVMTAVKTGAIRAVDDTLVSRPGPRIVEALRALALAIDPALTLPAAPAPSAAP